MRYAKCHPDKPHIAFGLCSPCYQRAAHGKRKRQGIPYWMAQGRTVRGWVNHLIAVKKWKANNRHREREYDSRIHARYVEMFGAIPSKNTIARFKWLEWKSQESK